MSFAFPVWKLYLIIVIAIARMDLDKLSADELDEAFRLLSRPFSLNRAFARPPPGEPPTTVFQTLGSSAPVSKLGQLGLLPLELMSNVCLGLDISSAFSFSQVSRHAREAISSVREFRLAGKYATGCLWVFLNTQVASHVDITAFYSALTTRSCSFCDQFGFLLSIPTVQRCCLRCFQRETKLQPSYLSELTRGVIGIPSASIIKRDYPVLRTIPNSYSWGHLSVSRSPRLCPPIQGHISATSVRFLTTCPKTLESTACVTCDWRTNPFSTESSYMPSSSVISWLIPNTAVREEAIHSSWSARS